MIQRIICKGCTKHFIFDLGYTEDRDAEIEVEIGLGRMRLQ